MAKTNSFKACDAQRKHLHEIASPPVRIRHHRVDKREWTARANKPSRKNEKRRSHQRPKSRAVTAAAILRYDEPEIECLHCGRTGDDPECGAACYRDFRKTILTGEDLVEIRDVGSIGYGAFTKPWNHIKKDQYLDEYFGDLRPFDSDDAGSLYNFFMPSRCIVDAEKSGNWTRFINSHCRPNVRAEPSFVGKRCCIVFKAIKDIGPGEELTFKYGKRYFEKAGFPCECGFCGPDGSKPKRKKV